MKKINFDGRSEYLTTPPQTATPTTNYICGFSKTLTKRQWGRLTKHYGLVFALPSGLRKATDYEYTETSVGHTIYTPMMADGDFQKYREETKAMVPTHEQLHFTEKKEGNEDVPCNPDPRAPHGFCRDASHSAGRYVCECEGWEPSEYDDLNKEITRLSRIEDVALEVVSSDAWSGDEFYDKLCKLKDTLGES